MNIAFDQLLPVLSDEELDELERSFDRVESALRDLQLANSENTGLVLLLLAAHQ